MNKVILIGRLTDNPEVRYSNKGDEALAVARYRLAVDRIGEGADFISCVAFGKQGEFAEKYLKKGTKVAVEGRIQTGSYEKDGKKVYTTDIVVVRHEFCERRSEEPPKSEGEFIDAVEEQLPFGQRR
jgi:single-strand DNA-binding protein